MRNSVTGRAVLAWVGVAVTVVFAYLAVRGVRFSEVWRSLRSSNYAWLVPAFLLLALAIFVRAVRWRFLFARTGRPSSRAVTESLLIGYLFNNILPARAGEVARVVALRRRAGTPVAEALSTVVVERVYDVLCLLVLLFVLLPWLPPVSWLHAAVILAGGLGLVLVAAIVVLAKFGERPLHVLLAPLARLPFVPNDRARTAARGLGDGLASMRQLPLAAGAVFWTFSSWLLLGLSFWCVTLGFDLDLSPVAGAFIAIATGLSMILPSSPGALGVFEAATVVALRPYGVAPTQALSYALVLHALNFFPFLVAGALVVRVRASELRRERRVAALDDGAGRL